MLKKYFDKQGALTKYDFSEVTEKNIEPIYKAWLSLPDTQRGEMERDFREIDALAAGGVKAIIDEAAYHGEDLAGILSEHNSFHEKAFWVFLERPKYWPAARAFCHADSIGSGQWNESRTKDHTRSGAISRGRFYRLLRSVRYHCASEGAGLAGFIASAVTERFMSNVAQSHQGVKNTTALSLNIGHLYVTMQS